MFRTRIQTKNKDVYLFLNTLLLFRTWMFSLFCEMIFNSFCFHVPAMSYIFFLLKKVDMVEICMQKCLKRTKSWTQLHSKIKYMRFLENERYIYALYYTSCSSKRFSSPGLDLDSHSSWALFYLKSSSRYKTINLGSQTMYYLCNK